MLTTKSIEAELAKSLVANGFKRKDGFFIININENVSGSLYFGSASHKLKDYIFIDVTVGVYHKDAEAIYRSLTKYQGNMVSPIISCQIGYVTPKKEYIEWPFKTTGEVQ